jgi:hypothetical protein
VLRAEYAAEYTVRENALQIYIDTACGNGG